MASAWYYDQCKVVFGGRRKSVRVGWDGEEQGAMNAHLTNLEK